MTQAILMGSRTDTSTWAKTASKSSSSGFDTILDSAGKSCKMGSENISETPKSDEEAKSEALAKELKEAASGVTVCKKCGSIFMGKTIAICTKCQNDLAAQRKEEADASQNASKEVTPDAIATTQTVSDASAGTMSE